MRISHETIYRSLFIQARGVLKKELVGHLRSNAVFKEYQHRRPATGTDRRWCICPRAPSNVADPAIPGALVGDLMTRSKNSHIATTVVERHSRFTMLVKVRGKDTASVVGALSKQVQKLPSEVRRSLTWDRSMKMAHRKTFTVATDVQVYFCDPQSPWQPGTNENTNRLLPQYFTKGTDDLSRSSQTDLNKVARRLNQRPRKTLGFHAPADKLQQSVVMIN